MKANMFALPFMNLFLHHWVWTNTQHLTLIFKRTSNPKGAASVPSIDKRWLAPRYDGSQRMQDVTGTAVTVGLPIVGVSNA
jgi:hypothetical protein